MSRKGGIIKLCNRPFSSIEEMNEQLISRWNSVVSPTDVVWHLGDVAFRHAKGEFAPIFTRLNGVKNMINGNHDSPEVREQPWNSIQNYMELKMDGKFIVLSHYPMRSWNKMYSGSIHFYGHEHGNIEDYSNCLDVGVDKWDFYPITLEQILERMSHLEPWVAQTKKKEETVSVDGNH